MGLHMSNYKAVPLSSNAVLVSAIQISCKLWFERFLKNLLADDQYSSKTKGSIYHIICTNILHTVVSELTRNLTFNEASTLFYLFTF